ncbi:MAG: acyl-CoA synthetase FdrA [Bacteriovoracaceae bacterium]|nr:acyl-CoA synthetase FdrA [Bacteriovoracaceae bacterium]
MVTKGLIKGGEYFDSVSLMIVAKKMNAIDGVEDSSVVMGTGENKAILDASGFLLDLFGSSNDTDLLVVVKAQSDQVADEVLGNIDTYLSDLRKTDDGAEDFVPKSFEGALKQLPDANLSLISVAGKYATGEAMKALENGINVMLFSDNISIEDEVMMKKFAQSKGLLVMGPDCGTAIINGAPLAFANVVARGDIGIVAASGTGLQEVTSLIHNYGAGISQAIGTGGRDVKEEVGGIMMIEGIKALLEDNNTKVIVLVSKPPHESVLKKIGRVVKGAAKPVISIFLGADAESVKQYGITQYETLQEAALHATNLSTGNKEEKNCCHCDCAIEEAKKLHKGQKYLRALYSGGTFCSETQLILSAKLGEIYSNAPVQGAMLLDDIWKSQGHTVVDLGEDDFTVGKPHPMIDFSTRNKRIIEEANDPKTAAILLDIVIGYGSNMDPLSEIVPNIVKAKGIAKIAGRHLPVICTVTGTDLDPQNRTKIIKGLKAAGAILCNSNADMSRMGLKLIKEMGR